MTPMNLVEATAWVHKHAMRSKHKQAKWLCKKPYNCPGVLFGSNKGALILAVSKFAEREMARRWRKRILDDAAS